MTASEPAGTLQRLRGMRVAVAVVAAVGLAVGCGGRSATTAPGTTAPASAPSTALPIGLPATSTTVFDATRELTPIYSLPPVEVTEPCPESNSGPDGGGGGGTMAESARLEPMLGQVLAYGGQHPDEFGTYGLIWHDAADASVFISLTSRLDEHRAALEGLVEHPEELIVCQVAVSGAVAQGIEATLVDELDGRFLSIGRGLGAIDVVLAADQEATAADLLARYGEAVQLTVGVLPYPLESAASVCPGPPPLGELPGLDISIVPPTGPLDTVGSQPLELTVNLLNVGSAPIQFMTGTSRGTILDPTGRVVSTSADVLLGDVGIGVDLQPGATTQLPLVATTASCDPQLGYTLPSGDYRLVAAVQHVDGDATTLYSPPLPITIGP